MAGERHGLGMLCANCLTANGQYCGMQHTDLRTVTYDLNVWKFELPEKILWNRQLRSPFTKWHEVISQKMWIFVNTVVRMPNLTPEVNLVHFTKFIILSLLYVILYSYGSAMPETVPQSYPVVRFFFLEWIIYHVFVATIFRPLILFAFRRITRASRLIYPWRWRE